MNWEIKSIDLWSAVKISFVANAVLGFVLGIFLGLIFAAMSQFLAPFMAMSGQDMGDLEAASGLGSLIVMPFFLAFFMAVIYGVIGTGILVLIYNFVAKFSGGIKVSLGSDLPQQEAGSTRPTLGYE